MDEDRDRLLYCFLEECRESPGRLMEWLRRYPDLSDDLLDLRMLDAELGEPGPAEMEAYAQAARAPIAEGSLSAVMLEAMRREESKERPALSSVVETARTRGLTPKALADALGIGLTIVAKMERRLFDPATVPRKLLLRLGETLGASVEQIQEYLRRPPTLSAAASYRARRAPGLHVAEKNEGYTVVAADAGLSASHLSVPAMLDRHGAPTRPNRADEPETRQEPTDGEANGTAENVREVFAEAIRSAPDMTDEQKSVWLTQDPGGTGES
jgi:DNA-binding transcriptional MerR regulator